MGNLWPFNRVFAKSFPGRPLYTWESMTFVSNLGFESSFDIACYFIFNPITWDQPQVDSVLELVPNFQKKNYLRQFTLGAWQLKGSFSKQRFRLSFELLWLQNVSKHGSDLTQKVGCNYGRQNYFHKSRLCWHLVRHPVCGLDFVMASSLQSDIQSMFQTTLSK